MPTAISVSLGPYAFFIATSASAPPSRVALDHPI